MATGGVGYLAAGSLFTAEDVAARAQVAVIDTRTRDTLFGAGANPLDAVLLVGRVPLRIVGVVNPPAGFGGNDSLNLYMPYTTAQARLLGSTVLRGITLRVADDADMAATERAVTALLAERHGRKDFFIVNTDEIRQTITATARTMAVLIGSIAVISLLVGGIGVMNIMLVSVSERIGEIGVRMAVSARRADIQRQVLIEAVLVSALGGALGVLLALGSGAVLAAFGSTFPLSYSPAAIVLAVVTSTGIGVFGYLPARSAARLDPVRALSPA